MKNMLLKNMFKKIVLTFLSFGFITFAYSQQHLRLWYNHPAKIWQECVPLGNGRLGAMPDGGVYRENIVLNDITLWSGGPQDADKQDAYKALPQIRKLIFEGKNAEAQKLVTEKFLCKGRGTGFGQGANDPYGCYQVLGDLHLKYDYGIDTALFHPEGYCRDLSLDSAVATCSFTLNGISYHREYFTSFANDVIIIRLSADKRGKINFTLSLNRPERYYTTVEGDELDMSGQLNNGMGGKGMRYLTRVKIKHQGGELIPGDSTLQIKGANEAIIYISAGTDFKNNLYKQRTAALLRTALLQPYQDELSSHVKDYQKLFDRASLSLDNQNLGQAALPTDERLIAYAKNPTDNGLPVLYFQFGRYLLICSTRPGLLPPNLQGLWANTIQTPWNGDYHLDINIEMNHWPLEVTNLPMLNEPFYSLINNLVIPGEKTAKTYFDSPGWVAFVVTNVWGYTSPGEGADWGSSQAGSGWLCQVLWNHYAFTQDKDYLRKIYPIIKGAAEFYLHSMVRDPNTGWLVTAPSESPENTFYLPDGKTAAICAGPTIDNDIIRELFKRVTEASGILHQDMTFAKRLTNARQQLPPDQIDSAGRLMEWLKPYRETDPHHRHMSPVWGVYPGNEISLSRTSKIAKAAKQLMIRRGDVSTGWSLAWKINLWARMQEGNHCFRLIKDLLKPTEHQGVNMENGGGTYPNMFDAHPPFQIDGNFGGTAGMAEMLVQSQDGYIQFLPALPDAWPDGSFKGFCVRGGGVVNAQWTDHKIISAELTAKVSNRFKIMVPNYVNRVELHYNGKIKSQQNPGKFININLPKGEKVKILFF
jgi:alpha-L-fucosidase 2